MNLFALDITLQRPVAWYLVYNKHLSAGYNLSYQLLRLEGILKIKILETNNNLNYNILYFDFEV